VFNFITTFQFNYQTPAYNVEAYSNGHTHYAYDTSASTIVFTKYEWFKQFFTEPLTGV